ncbi:MAG: hypothetical protein P9L97_13490 [Candidatus Tenebribacter davisii]|nr:hypothetical protein [Candidatus Tenebribacter davisii]
MSEFNLEIVSKLEEKFSKAGLLRERRVCRYDAKTILEYDVKSLNNRREGKIKLEIDKFVGGGFAGQVYRVKILENSQNIDHLEIGKLYAIKILIPPSGASKLFRDAIYRIGFGGQFQLQVNPAASRAGALWQKFIRRAAKIRFGNADTVVDIYATFIDETIGSCGEISEWIEGRTWQLEVDEYMDKLKLWQRGKMKSDDNLGSIEYRTKKIFMRNFVKLLHEIGGHEFARQYEWSTCKSQPNCLKRNGTKPDEGLVAVDFRAGLALLPFLPMSPGDFKLIFNGILRGSLVQFDRGNLKRLEAFVNSHKDEFSDMTSQLHELKQMETIYRNSVPDITHNHFRLLFSKKLWNTMLSSTIKGWKISNLISKHYEIKLSKHKFLTFWLFIIGLIPILGKYFIKLCGNKNWRNHYFKMLFNWKYLGKTIKATGAEKAIVWYRDERIEAETALKIGTSAGKFLKHLPLSILPAGLHKFLSNYQYFKEHLWFIFVRPFRLYFDSALRESWLLDMVEEGKKKHILSDEDAIIIESHMKEPFIQKYLKSLAVHILTLPITQIVSVLIAIIYVLAHPEMPKPQSWGIGLGIIALFQVIPISPGSLTRGLYVVYLVIKERDFKNYNIAVFLGFFKYIGYLAFPIQMTYKYPSMARFMAGHWATGAVNIIPVFGENGALAEHWVFRIFYNYPLTIRRQMSRRAEIRASQKERLWHIPLCIIITSALFGLADYYYLLNGYTLQTIKEIWWLGISLSLILGSLLTFFAGGLQFQKRIIWVTISGLIVSILYSGISYYFGFVEGIFAECVWRFFIFVVFSTTGAIITELVLGNPEK